MRIHQLTENTDNIIDNKEGWGNVPDNSNVDYMGLRVMMKPSTFLKLAAPLSEPTSSENIQNHLASGGTIGSPFLIINVPVEWADEDYNTPAKVSAHEGRNRMIAVKNLYGDTPIETHLFFRGGINRNRHINNQIIQQLQNNIYSEKSKTLINGPLFTV